MPKTNKAEFRTMTTDRHYLKTVLDNYQPDLHNAPRPVRIILQEMLQRVIRRSAAK